MPLSYTIPGVEEIRWLREKYGHELVLTDDDTESEPYRIVAEFRYEDRAYAVLQNKAMLKEEHDVAIFRLSNEGGVIDLETIEDDDEYEQIAEIFDDMWFA